jgi:hypothetical protein
MSKKYTMDDAAQYRAYYVRQLDEARTGEPFSELLADAFRKSQAELIAECKAAIEEFDASGAEAMIAKWQTKYDIEQQQVHIQMDCFESSEN